MHRYSRCKYLILYSLILLFSIGAYSQDKPLNLPQYDLRVLHFGFNLGYNQFSSMLRVKEPLPNPDEVIGLSVAPQHGFHLGILGDLKIHEYFRLRLNPTLSFSDRKFQYTVYDYYGRIKKDHTNIEAIYLETPLELKIQTKRWRNFRPYLIAGLKHAYDLASLKTKKIAEQDQLLRLNNNDWMYTTGAGFDFYLVYFKLGIELKTSFSFKDMHIPEPHKPYSNMIDAYKTQIFYFNITFE